MRIHSVKYIFLSIGYLSIYLLIIIIKLKSAYWSCTSTYDNILDISPCYRDIEQSLIDYFNKINL